MEQALEVLSNLKAFDASLRDASLFPLTSEGISVFQVNLGRLCNQACRHCHVMAGPARKEMMSDDVLGLCIEAVKTAGFEWVDITGGAPEMHPGYKSLIHEAARSGSRVRVRTNLTVLLEEGFREIPGFLAENNVEVAASLPYYLEETVDRQRGKGVFKASIEALKTLNSLGYGRGGKTLNLVYNPCGAFLPPSQKAIEADFRRELEKRHGVSFTNLFTITNMPIGRFLDFLKDSGNLEKYMERLFSSYNPKAAANVMCKNTLSVDWKGFLYDCDFNQVLGIKCRFGAPSHIKDFDIDGLSMRRIATGTHCYGCTAGSGSSCTGTVA